MSEALEEVFNSCLNNQVRYYSKIEGSYMHTHFYQLAFRSEVGFL